MIALYWPFPEAKAPLKLGQNSQRKIVPNGGGKEGGGREGREGGEGGREGGREGEEGEEEGEEEEDKFWEGNYF